MATQSDLEKLRKQLSDLDAKLKSMRGNSPQRNPNFDSAMANQNFKNSMAEQRARIEADRANRRMAPIPPPEQGKFTQGRLMGAPTNRPIPPGGGMGGLTADQAGIPADQRKILDDLMARQAQQPIPPGGGMGGSIGAPENMRSPNMPKDIMQAYNNFLQQGMQNSNALNQGAMTDFANMEPGMQATQPATGTTPKPAMPIAGMGMQKSSTAPRKFSTVKASPPRFG
jgi:hypothetical protein